MRKILTMFSLVFILPGCGGGRNQCRVSGFPNDDYIVVYPDGFQTNGTLDPLGVSSVPNRGYTCDMLRTRTFRNFRFSLTADPASVYLPSPPASGTINGQSFDATYGMPRVDYFDNNGYLVGSVYATSVLSDGTSLQANMPDLSSVYSGTYQVRVSNKTYDGYYLDIVGTATMDGWGRERPDSDGDGWYDDEDCAPYDPYLNYDCVQTCGGSGLDPYTICQSY
jgi:hypothetical protein